MKRKAVCIFALIAYVLLFCTLTAPVIEREMATLAEVKYVKKNAKSNTQVPQYAYHWGEVEGLFQVKEGSGWNTGSRVEEIPRQYYSVGNHFYSNISLHPENYTLILSASRTPKVGDRVEPVELEEKPNEKIIIYCPEGYREIVDRQDKFTVLGAGEKGIYMNTSSSEMPFFEGFAAFSLQNRLKADYYRVYSYSDAESLLRSLPLVAVYGAVLLFAVVVWAGTCYLTRIQQSRWLLWANAGCGVLTLGAVLRLGRAIDLPASLMPPESILDFSHYQKEFSNIFAAMEEVGDTSLQTLSTKCCAAALAVLLAGALLGAAILLIEGILLKRKKNA